MAEDYLDEMSNYIFEKIKKERVIAIIRGVSNDTLPSLTKALYDGGIRLIEITINQAGDIKDTLDAISFISEEYDGKMAVGAGTVLTAAQVESVVSAGAKYVLSPNASQPVIERTKELGLVSIPGAFTPTEIEAAYEWGADIVKVFPASNLGPAYIKAIRAPLNHIPLIAVGGINADNSDDFMKAGVIGLGVGGALTSPKESLESITALAQKIIANIQI
jgi:2-dehydro-3-deoxyphosphogluconate aldolase/(4S)-4-hydroxy-2-oxoglutarate aldolase